MAQVVFEFSDSQSLLQAPAYPLRLLHHRLYRSQQRGDRQTDDGRGYANFRCFGLRIRRWDFLPGILPTRNPRLTDR